MAESDLPDADHGGHWIWPATVGDGPNQYLEFRHEFDAASSDEAATMYIATDSEYAVWLNEAFVDCGQFPDFPSERTMDRLGLTAYLRSGRNILRILVHYQGVDSFQYIKAPPGLYYCMRIAGERHVSGIMTQWRPSCYRQGDLPRITGQLGFTFEHDARQDHPWRMISADDLVEPGTAIEFRPRPVPKLICRHRTAARIVAQGVLRRDDDLAAGSVAATMQADFLSSRTAKVMFSPNRALPSEQGVSIRTAHLTQDGFYIVIDLGQEEVGFLDLELDAAEGSVVDIANGEHLDDLRVRSRVGGRHFAHRYICKQGRQRFTHYLMRVAGRYLSLHVIPVHGPVTLYFAGLVRATFPVVRGGSLRISDDRDQRIYDTSVRTLELCMHEHYEDCPWREQALYANDARNQALAGYYAFGNDNFAATSLNLLGRGLGPDGWLEMCAPARIDHTIPSFSLVWILAAADHWWYCGNRGFVESAAKVAGAILMRNLERVENGLLPCPTGQRYWHFYDWAPGLSGDSRLADRQRRYDAPLNFLFILALKAGSVLADAAGRDDHASRYREHARDALAACDRCFWDDRHRGYRTYVGDDAVDHHAELTQSLAILCRLPSSAIASELRQRLMRTDNGWIPTTLSQSLYKFEALLTDRARGGRWVFDQIRADWGSMLRRGATSFWETLAGADDFEQAGSLCHGWSAIPAYFLPAHLLGVRPLEPGFRSFEVDPLVDLLTVGKAAIPTPHGPISIAWHRQGGHLDYEITSPPGAIARHNSRG